MDALFACTKCHSRHPFDELSSGKQLCKSCRNDFPVVKCTYCRAEFQHDNKVSTSSICKKCVQNVKNYGKPRACEYCNVIAAFIGNKCQRCTNCEKKHGLPQNCEQCKQQCAFDRKDGSRKKVDGKLLCWLCTMSYKRVLAKTKPKSCGNTPSGNGVHSEQRNSNVENSPANRTSSGNLVIKSASSSNLTLSSSTKRHHHHQSSGNKHPHHASKQHGTKHTSDTHGNSKGGKTKDDVKSSSGVKRERERDKDKASGTSSGKQKTDPSDTKPKEPEGTPASKKPKLEKNSNGLTQAKSSVDSLGDYSVSENVVVLTQLRGEVETMKKQLQMKDQQILEKEKKLTELKAQNWEAEKEMRNRVQLIQKQHSEALSKLQEKNRDLLKQVATLSKANKSSSSKDSKESRESRENKESRDKDRESRDKDRESRDKDRESRDKDRESRDKDRESRDKDRESKDKDNKDTKDSS